jgi:hypothetical protein
VLVLGDVYGRLLAKGPGEIKKGPHPAFLYFTKAFRKQAAIDVAQDEHLQKRQQVADDPTDGLYSTAHRVDHNTALFPP